MTDLEAARGFPGSWGDSWVSRSAGVGRVIHGLNPWVRKQEA